MTVNRIDGVLVQKMERGVAEIALVAQADADV